MQVNILNHYNFQELVVDAIDVFNKRLKELNAPFSLLDNPDALKDNYNVNYASKKNGLPKDDYPGKLLSDLRLLTQLKYVALSLNSSVKTM